MSKYRFKVAKLVRDKVVDLMRASDVVVHSHTMQKTEYLQSLKKKILEEAHEVHSANSDEMLKEEIGDLLDVIHALARASEIDIEEIEQVRRQKTINKGSFDSGVYCDYIEMSANHPDCQYYKKQPGKYPQIDTSEA